MATANRFSLASCCVLLAMSLAGGEKERAADSDLLPEKLTLYSMKFADPNKEPKTAETFHGYPVLGKVEITDPKRRQKIVRALNDGLAHGDPGAIAFCFGPRHAIRIVKKGQIVDYLICFQCSQVRKYVGNADYETLPITGRPRGVFNEVLKQARIPLSPEPDSKEEK